MARLIKYFQAILTTAVVGSTAAVMPALAEVKIGIIVPVTGQEANAGQDMENAVKLAVAKANAAGGVLGEQITTVTADDACDPTQGAIAASKLVSSEVTAIVGGYCSGAVLPTLKIYGDAKMPFVISAGNSGKLVQANLGNAFMINSTANAQVVTAMELLKKLDAKTIVLIDQGDAYSSDLAKLTDASFTKSGGKVLARETVNSGEQDFSSLVTKVKQLNPDVVFWSGYYNGSSLLTKQLRQAGVKSRLLLSDANNTADYLKIAGSAADGALILSPPVLEFLPDGNSFKTEYVKANRREPGAYASLTYDATNLVLDAIKRAGSAKKDAIIDELKKSSFNGIAGPIQFTPELTLVGSNFTVLVNKGGAWVPFK